MVPCSPTLSINSAIKFPISLSPLAEMVATLEIISLVSTGLDLSLMLETTASTAWLIPLLKSMGFIPAATDLVPSLKIALAKTVAQVVPSPASSLVLEATDLTRLAPMFSNLSENSMALATVTPSLVILGDPKLYSITTFLPLGPMVTWTASANFSHPESILFLHSVAKESSLAKVAKGAKVNFWGRVARFLVT